MIMKFTSDYMILQSNIAPPYQVGMVSTLIDPIAYVISKCNGKMAKIVQVTRQFPSMTLCVSVKCVTGFMQPYIKDKL
jgi:hypothetical protein